MPSQPQLTQYDGAVLIIARRISRIAESDSRLKGRFTLEMLRAAVKDELDVQLPRSASDGPVGRLIQSGEITVYPAKERIPGSEHGNGTRNVYRAPSVDQMHLGRLIDFARAQIRPDDEVPTRRGRTGLTLEARTRILLINEKQFGRIRTMARHVAFHLMPRAESEDDAYTAVHGVHLMWDPADGLEGDWRPMYDLIRASRPKPNVVPEYKGAARLLLDLAANHGYLIRERITERYVVPTTWIDVQGRWCAAAEHPGIAAVLGTNCFLGAISEVLGPEVDPEALTLEQTKRVVEHVQDALLADRSLTTGHKTSIRRSIRRLMDAGLVPLTDVNGYDYRQRHRMAAWSSTVTGAIARAVASGRRGPGLDWIPEKDGKGRPWKRRLADAPGYAVWKDFPFPVLADPDHPYSLARCVDFHTATDHSESEERTRRGFRGLGTFPRVAPRETSSVSDVAWNEATTAIRLSSFALYIGWVLRHTEINLETASMADLIRPDLLRDFKTAAATGAWSTPNQAQRALVAIGLVASPCLEDEAVRRGEEKLADQFFAASCLATGLGERSKDGSWSGITLHDGLRPAAAAPGARSEEDEDEDELGDEDVDSPDYAERVQRQRAKAERVESTYQRVLGVDWAYDGMVLLYNAAQGSVLRELGVASIAELRARWMELVILRDTLIALRALSCWNILLAAPMRTRTARHVTRRMLKEHRNTLNLSVPAKYMKVPANGPYRVQIRGGEGDGFDYETHRVYTDLAWPALLTSSRTGGETRNARYLWVNDWSRARTSRDQVLAATLNGMVRKVVELASDELGLTAEQRQDLLDIAQVHNFRHAVAGKLVNEELAERAAKLLHQNGTTTLRKVYAAGGLTPSTGDIRAGLTSLMGPGTSVEVPASDLVTRIEQATPEERAAVSRLLGMDEAAA